MKVILLKTVQKLGKADDVISVPDGYAINALFPKKLAIPATDAAIAARDRKLHNKATSVLIAQDLLDRAIATISNKNLTYAVRANEKGSLFSKLDLKEISDMLMKEYRVSIDPKHMNVAEGQIKQVGTYTITVSDGGYTGAFTIVIVAK